MKNRKTVDIETLKHVEVETFNVNSPQLIKEFIVYANETLNNSFFHDLSNEHDRQIITDSLEYFCSLLHENNILEQYDIVFDKRNNRRKDMDAGKFYIEIKFKQTNCLNVTSVKYFIEN